MHGILLDVLLSSLLLAGETPVLLKDINQFSHLSSPPLEMIEFKGHLVFRGFDHSTGWELWSSDGTNAGTQLLADVSPGRNDSSPESMTVAGDLLYFLASGPGGRRELWRTDGTTEGTAPVKDIAPVNDSHTAILGSVNGWLIFSANDEVNGWEPWRTNGSPQETSLLKDLLPGPTGSIPHEYGTFTGQSFNYGFFIYGSNGNGEQELWKTDGTPEGTVKFRDLFPLLGPFPLLQVLGDGRLIMVNDGRVWESDGTPEGTKYLFDLTVDADLFWRGVAAVLDHGLLFNTYSPSSGYQLWSTDLTSEGTIPILGQQVLPATPTNLVLAGRAYFLTYSGGGYQLWSTDGSPEGTRGVVGGFEYQTPMVILGDSLLFPASERDAGTELMQSNGSLEGTRVLKDIIPGYGSSYPRALTSAMGQVFFIANTLSGAGLWRTDGTPEGTLRVKEDLFPGYDSSNPTWFTELNGLLLFAANDGARGEELWASGGAGKGTFLIKDIFPGPVDSNTSNLTVSGGQLFFSAKNGEHGQELWRSDGTPGGTFLVKDLNPGPDSLSPQRLTPVGDGVYFIASQPPTHRFNLWRSDGTPEHTRLVKDLAAEGWSVNFEIADRGGIALFGAYGPTSRTGLWRSDGTEEGTVLLKEFAATPPERLQAALGAVFFAVRAGSTGADLWRSDGTPDGTVNVRFIPADPAVTSFNIFLHGSPDRLFIQALQGSDWLSLWKSDGTPEGTLPLREGLVRRIKFFGLGMAQLTGGKLFFLGDDGEHGAELWKSDGTPEGTSMVLDIAPGAAHSAPNVFESDAGVVYFTAQEKGASPPPEFDGGPVGDLWRSDGTPEGTWKLGAPPGGGRPGSSFEVVNGKLFFSAHESTHGTELWAVQVGEAEALRGDATADGSLDISDPVSLLGCLFLGHACPASACARDVNADGQDDLSDAVFLLSYLFLGGKAPIDC